MSASRDRPTTSTRSACRPARPTCVLGCDLVVSGAKKVLAAVRQNHTIFVANTAEIMPGDFARSADFSLPVERLKRAIREAAGDERAHFFDATRTADGAVRQFARRQHVHAGLRLPAWRPAARPPRRSRRRSSSTAQAVAMNVAAFRWGRRAAHEPDFVRGLIAGQGAVAAADRADARRDHRASRRVPDGLSEPALCPPLPAPHRRDTRSRGQGRAGLDGRQRGGGAQPVQADGGQGRVRGCAALYRRLLQAPARAQFQGYERLEFHLAPPLLGRKGPDGKAAQVDASARG